MYAMSDEAFPTMEMSTANSTLAQQSQINVTGTVTDANNEPLIGVNVKLKEQQQGQLRILMVNLLLKQRKEQSWKSLMLVTRVKK